MRTFEGTVYPTYNAVYLARGLLTDDTEWDRALRKAGLTHSGRQLRNLFFTILTAYNPSNPAQL